MTELDRNSAPKNPPEHAGPQGIPGPGGVVLDQYILLEKLSSSRTGLIFKARHRLMGRIAAVRFLSPEAAASATLTARFHRAIQILARLRHRNLVEAFEAGDQGGSHYLVMEYFDGQDLRSIVKERKAPLGVEEAVHYTVQAAAGLAVAHQQGVCHRNIKPGNLLVDREGLLKIVGFTLAHVEAGGAASEAGVDDNLTRQGQAIGTYEYMAPEQAMDSSSVDRRADIYSLGCTLHFLLTGRQPYATTPGMQQVLAHRSAAIPSLCQARPDVPEALDRVFRKMLAKSPGERYASMPAVIADLEASLTAAAPAGETTADNLRAIVGLPATAARSIAPGKAVPKPKARAAKRGPRIVPLVVGGVLAVLAFVFAVQYFQDKRAPEVAKSPAPRETSEQPPPATDPDPTSSQGQLPKPSSDASSSAAPPVTTPEPPATSDETVAKPSQPPKKEHPASKPAPAPKPVPNPQPKPKPDAAPAMAPKAAATAETSLLPVPDEAARKRAAQLVRDLFHEEMAAAHSGAEKSALARKILRQANGLSDDPAGRYVMLIACFKLAKEAGDPATAMEAVDSMSGYFAVEAWPTKVNMLADFAKDARSSLHHGAIAEEASALAQKAISEAQFETAATLSALAVAEAGLAHDPQASTRLRLQAKEINKAVALYRGYEAAQAKLQGDPQDPEANLVAGRYECLTQGNWRQGLPKLAAGSDESLRDLAAHDLADPKDPQQQAGLADGWWELAKGLSGTAQVQVYRRAARWYEKASSQATGLLKGKIEKRLGAIKTIDANAVSH